MYFGHDDHLCGPVLRNVQKGTTMKPATKINMEALKEDLKAYPDGYLKERAERLNVSHNCIWRALKRLKITYKKNSTAP